MTINVGFIRHINHICDTYATNKWFLCRINRYAPYNEGVPKIVPQHELDAICRLIEQHPSGVGFGILADSVMNSFELTLEPRTLQRRLNRLVKDGRIVSKGVNKGVLYFPVEQQKKAEVAESPHSIPLTQASFSLRNKIMQPITRRNPVGYDINFLNSYKPNESYYIDKATREKLADFGNVGIEDLPAGTYLLQLMDRLLIDLSWNSSRLEGNTYSLLETQRLIDMGIEAEGKGLKESKMILNHKAAIELLASQSDSLDFNAYTICNLHALLADGLLHDTNARGRLRTRAVGISSSVFLPLENPQLIDAQFQLFLQKASAIKDPIEQSFFVMVHLPYLQPFEDVNKRVSRLAANIPMMKHNLCPLSFVDVPKDEYVYGLLSIYELKKIDYLRDIFVWSYERSASKYSAIQQTLGEPDPFRFKYRLLLYRFVNTIVGDAMDKESAIEWIAENATREVPIEDQERFIEIVEIELMSLHIGSIARFKLLPNVFDAWQRVWNIGK